MNQPRIIPSEHYRLKVFWSYQLEIVHPETQRWTIMPDRSDIHIEQMVSLWLEETHAQIFFVSNPTITVDRDPDPLKSQNSRLVQTGVSILYVPASENVNDPTIYPSGGAPSA